MLDHEDMMKVRSARARKAQIKELDKVKLVEIHQEQRKNPKVWKEVHGVWVPCTRCHSKTYTALYSTDILDPGRTRPYICNACMQRIITAWESENNPLPAEIPIQSETPGAMETAPEKRKHVKREDRR